MSDETLPRTYLRTEAILGPIHGVDVIETDEDTVTYELNVIDGWVKLTNRVCDDGIFHYWPTSTPATVREVLDAVPSLAQWVAETHLAWCRALKLARDRRAPVEKGALTRALKAHGLALRGPVKRPTYRLRGMAPAGTAEITLTAGSRTHCMAELNRYARNGWTGLTLIQDAA